MSDWDFFRLETWIGFWAALILANMKQETFWIWFGIATFWLLIHFVVTLGEISEKDENN